MEIGANNFLDQLTVLKNYQSKRISSWDRTGGNRDWITISPGDKAILADIKGPGCIRHIYATLSSLDRFYYRNLIIRIYWDEEEKPSVEVPLGDFFGIGHCKVRYFTSLLLTVNPGALFIGTDGLNSYFPMPFSKRCLIEVVNESDFKLDHLWYHIDYEEYDKPEQNLVRFHAQWRRENPCRPVLPESVEKLSLENQTGDIGKNLTGKENYVILEAEGKGNYAGCLLNVDNIVGGWWGEGDDMIFIDGEKWPPSFHGTGTEEIFGGGACPNVEYSGPYTGFHLISHSDWSGKNSMYRFFIADPIRFQESIKVTIEHGHANNLANDYSSVAYWYQTEPHKEFSPLLPREKRAPITSAEGKELLGKEKRINEIVQKKGGALFWAKYSEEERKKMTSLRGKINEAFDKEEYQKASQLWDDIIKIARIKLAK
jgi:hypothetical protein